MVLGLKCDNMVTFVQSVMMIMLTSLGTQFCQQLFLTDMSLSKLQEIVKDRGA